MHMNNPGPSRSTRATPLQAVVCTALKREFAAYFAAHELRSVAILDASKAIAAWICSRPSFFLCDFAPAQRGVPVNGCTLLRAVRQLDPEGQRGTRIVLMAHKPNPFAAAWAMERLGADRVIARSPHQALETILGRPPKASRQEIHALHDLREVEKLFREFAGPAASEAVARVTDDLKDGFALIDHFGYAQLLANQLTSQYMRKAFLQSAEARLRSPSKARWPTRVVGRVLGLGRLASTTR